MSRTGLLLIALVVAGPLAGVRAQEAAGYPLPLVLGPQAVPWRLLAGQATRDDSSVALCGGTCLILSEYRYGDCVLELDYRSVGPQVVEPIFYFRADVTPGDCAVSGPCVRLTHGNYGQRPRLRRHGRVIVADQAWRHVRIAMAGDRATVYVDGACASLVSCARQRDGLLAIRVAGDAGSCLVFSHLQVTETGYRSLFNGTDLSGWEGADADAAACWKATDGLLQCTGQEGPWLRTREEFGDFRLRLEYRLGDGGNSGLYVRVPRDGNHHGAGAGVEVQILDDASDRYRDLKPYQFSASLYAVAPAVRGSARPPGAWNSLDVRCAGHHYTVTHNGQVVLNVSDRDYPELAVRLARGFLGLQNHSEAVWFRHLRIGPP